MFEISRNQFKKVEITQLSYMPSWKTFWGQKCVEKFESEQGFRLLEIIAARVIRNGTVVCAQVAQA